MVEVITGANGLAGPWVAKTLVERGACVTVLVGDSVSELSPRLLGLSENVNVVADSVGDFSVLEGVLA